MSILFSEAYVILDSAIVCTMWVHDNGEIIYETSFMDIDLYGSIYTRFDKDFNIEVQVENYWGDEDYDYLI